VQQGSKADKQRLHQLQDKQQKEVDKLKGELLQVPL